MTIAGKAVLVTGANRGIGRALADEALSRGAGVVYAGTRQPFTHPALVTNMSTGGLVIQGVRRKIRAGEILDVRMGDEKAQFRVVWVGRQGRRRQGQIGVESLSSEPFIWDVNLLLCAQVAGIG